VRFRWLRTRCVPLARGPVPALAGVAAGFDSSRAIQPGGASRLGECGLDSGSLTRISGTINVNSKANREQITQARTPHSKRDLVNHGLAAT